MAYECQKFKQGQILTHECMNKIDEWLAYICSKEIVSGEVNADGELVFTLCDGSTMSVGKIASTGGDNGNDGFSPTVEIIAIEGGKRIIITDINGPQSVDIMDGEDGVDGKNGSDGYTPQKGVDYFDGKNGSDGVSPTVSVSKSGKVTTVTITDKNGTKTATINDGSDGASGKDGSNGVSATHSWNGTTLTVTSASGTSSANLKGDKGDTGSNGSNGVGIKSVVQTTTSSIDGGSNVITVTKTDDTTSTFTIKNGREGSDGKDGYTPIKGVDYYTEADKAEIVAAVIESLGGNPIFGIVDENNNIIVNGDLPDGTYTVKYEMEGGKIINIGNLVLDTNVYYTVTKNLTNCTISNSATQAVQGGSYSATITANDGFELKSVSVTMGGSAVSVSGGNISIANVTGNIVITAVAEEVKAAYTNYAKNFETGRLRSGGTVDSSTTAATTCSDYIPFTPGTVVRVKGFGALTDYNVALYDKNGTAQSVSKANAATTMITYAYDSASGVVTLTSLHASITTIRVSGILTGSTSDVIITVNEEIV